MSTSNSGNESESDGNDSRTERRSPSLICGATVQRDHSQGQGHCWRFVDSLDLPASIRQEIEAEIIDGGHESHENYRASNGQYYRWA